MCLAAQLIALGPVVSYCRDAAPVSCSGAFCSSLLSGVLSTDPSPPTQPFPAQGLPLTPSSSPWALPPDPTSHASHTPVLDPRPERCCALPRPLSGVGPRTLSSAVAQLPQWELPDPTAATQVWAPGNQWVERTGQSLCPSTQPVCKGMGQAQGSRIRDQELSGRPEEALFKAGSPLEGTWRVKQGRRLGPPACAQVPTGPLSGSLTGEQ